MPTAPATASAVFSKPQLTDSSTGQQHSTGCCASDKPVDGKAVSEHVACAAQQAQRWWSRCSRCCWRTGRRHWRRFPISRLACHARRMAAPCWQYVLELICMLITPDAICTPLRRWLRCRMLRPGCQRRPGGCVEVNTNTRHNTAVVHQHIKCSIVWRLFGQVLVLSFKGKLEHSNSD